MLATRLKTEIARLVAEGEEVLQTRYEKTSRSTTYFFVNARAFSKFHTGCINLARVINEITPGAICTFTDEKNVPSNVDRMVGRLLAFEAIIDNDFLFNVQDLVFAEAFNHLLDQADHLLQNGYLLAAGVLGRAVLEEQLRKLCNQAQITPNKERPTINDYKDALYKGKFISLNVMKHIEAMAAVGNQAAHAKGSLEKTEVERLLRDVREFLQKHP